MTFATAWDLPFAKSTSAGSTATVVSMIMSGKCSWMNRFLNYAHAAGCRFDFFSFEFYPFDDICSDAAPQLLEIPKRLRAMMTSLRADGVPTEIPWVMTEFGYSVFAGRHEVDIEGALFNAD